MIATNVRRPRNVDVPRAAAILYGDWGTSKAYVIGLAFAVGGYASFWLIAAMCVLTALVGIHYIVICRLYPDGGGVYASVRHRSEVISIVGGFLPSRRNRSAGLRLTSVGSAERGGLVTTLGSSI
jgi:hypothetical protein